MSVGALVSPKALTAPTPQSAHPDQNRFIDASIGDFHWRVRPAYLSLLFDDNGLRLTQWKDEGTATLVKAGAGRTIHRVRVPGADVYVKHFRATNPVSLVHQCLKQGRARKEFDVALELADVGVPTITPIALGERR